MDRTKPADRMLAVQGMRELWHAERTVLSVLAWHDGPGGARPSIDRIAKLAGMSRFRVVDHLKSIRRKGRVDWVRGRTVNVYTIAYGPMFDRTAPAYSDPQSDCTAPAYGEIDGHCTAKQIVDCTAKAYGNGNNTEGFDEHMSNPSACSGEAAREGKEVKGNGAATEVPAAGWWDDLGEWVGPE